MRRAQRWSANARIAARRWMARARQVIATEPGAAADQGDQAAACARAEQAGRLRGGVAKAAQLAGYLAAFDLDDDARAALASLWDAAPAMTMDDVAAVLRDDLDATPGELFARWQDVPIASASLGQVHLAADADGTEYAVKVQYPDVADALREDLAAGGLIRELAGGALGIRLGDDAAEELRGAILRELDYTAEADAMDRFARAFEADPDIVIPAVDRARSSRRVLTMRYVHGLRVRDLATQAESVRSAAASIILRFAWTGVLRHGIVHGDPNPGNCLVLPGPPVKVAFLDFGCTGELDDSQRAGEIQLWRALLRSDRSDAAERFRQAMHEQRLITSARCLHSDGYREWERLVTAPLLARDRFAWSERHAAQLVEATRRLSAAGALAMPPSLLLCWRQRLGVAAVLGMIGAPADARAVLETALASG